MATINELLNLPTEDIGKLNDEQLKEYLRDIISLEPTPKIKIIGDKDDDSVEEDDNPIKHRKKSQSKLKKLKTNPKDILRLLGQEIDKL